MSRWPVEKPPIDPHPPAINLAAQPPDPIVFDGPLNLFIALEGHATAYVNAAQTKHDYDTIVPVPSQPMPAQPEKTAAEVRPISVGSSLPYQRKDALPANDIATRHIYRIKS